MRRLRDVEPDQESGTVGAQRDLEPLESLETDNIVPQSRHGVLPPSVTDGGIDRLAPSPIAGRAHFGSCHFRQKVITLQGFVPRRPSLAAYVSG